MNFDSEAELNSYFSTNAMSKIHTELYTENFKITVHVMQRNKNKCITIIEGLDNYDIDKPKFLVNMRKKCSCNGNIDKESGFVKLQGDQKDVIKEVLVKVYKVSVNNIIIRGV